MTPTIRQAAPGDIDGARYVGFATWPSTYGPLKGARYVVEGLDSYWSDTAIRASIASGNIIVAETSRGIVGMAEIEELGDDLVMWKLYVLPSEHGAGYGRALVAAAKARARDQGRDLLTEHDEENAAASGFYACQGFQQTSPPWPGTNAVWLRWRHDSD